MVDLARGGVEPSVVDDQIGRPTFAADIAAGIRRLLEANAPYGTYNLTGAAPEASWADVAADGFTGLNHYGGSAR
jgi:dTDP-4-dehydrorhamnose 3,5-epimerase